MNSKHLKTALILLTLNNACGLKEEEEGKTGVDESQVEYDLDVSFGLAEEKCLSLRVTGCIRGQVAHATNFFVNGLEFFDADELVEYLGKALSIKDSSGIAVPAEDLDIAFTQNVSNENFASKFDVAVAGPSKLDDAKAVGTTGSFLVAKLPVDTYLVRAYRRFDVSVVLLSTYTQLDYCITIYQDKNADVEPGTLQNLIFDDFSLRSYQRRCNKISPSDLTLPGDDWLGSQSASLVREQTLTLSNYTRINGLTNISSVIDFNQQKLALTKTGAASAFGQISEGRFSEINLSGFSFKNYRTYELLQGSHDSVYLLDASEKKVYRFSSRFVLIDSFSLDCRSLSAGINQAENVFIESSQIHYLDSTVHEVCSLSDGSLKSSTRHKKSGILTGTLLPTGRDLLQIPTSENPLLKMYTVGGQLKAKIQIEGFPFSRTKIMTTAGQNLIFGCRDTSCYYSTLNL